jgi:hypothetical protein
MTERVVLWHTYGSDSIDYPVDGPEDKIRPNPSKLGSTEGGPTPSVTKSGLTLEEGINLLDSYTADHGALLMLRGDGTYDYVERPNQPCIGWMRVYGKGNLRDSYWPGDLIAPHRLFPDGLPVRLNKTLSIPASLKDFVEETFLSPIISPWRSALFDISKSGGFVPKFHLIIDKKNYLRLIFDNLDIEPTQLVSLLRSMRGIEYNVKTKYDSYLQSTKNKAAAFALALNGAGAFGAGANWDDIKAGKPKEWTPTLFSQRGAYRRAVVEFPFGKSWTGVPPKTIAEAVKFFEA